MKFRRKNLTSTLGLVAILACGDPIEPPITKPPQEKPPVQQIQPLAFTSSPKQECYENTFYLYQPTVTGGTNTNRTFSFTGPSWLKIDQAGLMTGICPEVQRDSVSAVEIVVAEGTNKATQKWALFDRNTSNSYTISPKAENPLVAVAESSLTFAKPVSYAVGDILGADTSQMTPYGALRKVISISGDKIRVNTQQATLEEVIKNGTFSFKGTLSPSSMKSFVGIEGVTLSPNATKGVVIDLVNVDLWDGVILNGYFDLSTDFYFKGNVKFIKLDYLDVGNKSKVISDVTLGVNISGLAEKKEVLIGTPVYLSPITVPSPAGGVPIVVVPKFGLYAGINPTHLNPISVRIKHESSLEIGVKYDNSWNLYSNLSNKFVFSNPVVTGDWDLDVYIKPKITFLVDGVIGASAGISAGLGLKTSDTGWELHGKLAAGLGVSAEVFSHVIASYYKDIITYDTLLAEGKIVTPLEKILFSRYQNFDGSVYLNQEVYTIDPDGSNKTNITNTPNIYEGSPASSPNGSKLAFSRLDYNNEKDREIFVMDMITKAITRLTNNDYDDGSPIWSPDGTKIAYSSQGDIWIMDPDGFNKKNITQTSGLKESHPAWSPNGLQMVFDAHPANGSVFDRDVYKIDIGTGQITRLTSDTESYSSSWAPNQDLIAFISRRCNSARTICGDDISLMDSQGNYKGSVTNDYHTTNEVAISWSPDGSKLVYQYMIPDGWGYSELWVINADGSNKHKVLDRDDIHSPFWGFLKTK